MEGGRSEQKVGVAKSGRQDSYYSVDSDYSDEGIGRWGRWQKKQPSGWRSAAVCEWIIETQGGHSEKFFSSTASRIAIWNTFSAISALRFKERRYSNFSSE